MLLATAPLNHRLGKGDEVSLPSTAKANIHGSTELKRTHSSALPHVTMPTRPLHRSTAVIPVTPVPVLITTQGSSQFLITEL